MKAALIGFGLASLIASSLVVGRFTAPSSEPVTPEPPPPALEFDVFGEPEEIGQDESVRFNVFGTKAVATILAPVNFCVFGKGSPVLAKVDPLPEEKWVKAKPVFDSYARAYWRAIEDGRPVFVSVGQSLPDTMAASERAAAAGCHFACAQNSDGFKNGLHKLVRVGGRLYDERTIRYDPIHRMSHTATHYGGMGGSNHGTTHRRRDDC